MLIYNLFRHKDEVDLYCAVPEDRPVPTFLTEDQWEYARSLNTISPSCSDVASGPAKDGDFILFRPRPLVVPDNGKPILLE